MKFNSRQDLESTFDREYFVWNGKGQAKGYRGYYADFPENLKFVEYIKSLKPESVLDAGCAYGFLVKRLNSEGIPTEGFDVSQFAHKMRVTDKVKVASVLDLSYYRDKQFDLVVSIELLEHIREEDTDQALRELSHVSKRGVHWIAYKEVDDLFQTKDITHINIKPYQWWVDRIRQVCGSTHHVVHKETEWYPNAVKIPQGQSKTGLNIGCFTTMLTNTPSTVWYNVDALNLAQYAAAYGYTFIHKDVRQGLPFGNDSVDYIVASHFLEHLTREEAEAFLKECLRVLKPEGVMRLSVPDASLLIDKYRSGELGYFDEANLDCEKAETQLEKLNTLLWSGHKTVYDQDRLSRLLRMVGFEPTNQSFNKSSRPDLMNQIFDYHADLSLFMEAQKPIHVVTPHKEKLRIAVISTPYITTPPQFYGGLEQVVADLCVALSQLGHDVTLFATKGSKPIGDYKIFETIEPVPDFGVNWSKINWLDYEKRAYLTFKDKLGEFDIINGHNWWGFEYIAKMENPSLKVCHTHHGGWLAKTKPPGVDKMNLIAISEFMANVYTAQGFPAKTCYNGINLEAYPFSANHGDRLVYLGRFVSFKQPDIAIQVAQKCGLGLDLVGGASEAQYFEEKVKPYIDGETVKLHWKATHEEKIKILQSAKALLFPSKMGEPYGLCAVEAMSCGCPVLALNDGAIPEVVKEGGVVCDVYDVSFTREGPVVTVKRDAVEAMVEAFHKIDSIKSEDCRRNAEKFSREKMAENYLKRYLDILKGDEW